MRVVVSFCSDVDGVNFIAFQCGFSVKFVCGIGNVKFLWSSCSGVRMKFRQLELRGLCSCTDSARGCAHIQFMAF